MAIDVLMIGLRHIHGTQGGVETHVRHLASELALQGLNIAIAVRKREHTRSMRQVSATGQKGRSDSVGDMRRDVEKTETDKAQPEVRCGSRLAKTMTTTDYGVASIRIVPVWSPRIVALDAVLHSLLCVLYAAVMRPRIVHIHPIGPSIVTPFARLLGLRVVATHHGQDYRREKWGAIARAVLRLGEKMQAAFANEIICVSKSLSAALKHRYQRSYIHVPNGTPAANPAPSPDVLETLGLKPNGYVLTVGRLVPEKRHLDLIDAFHAANIPNVKLVIVGSGQPGHTDRLLRRAGHSTGIIMAGFRDGEELEALYANALVFALPSSHEGLPIALLEAMAHGCEIIVSDIAPHREMGFSKGRYHPVGDIPALSARLRNVALRAALTHERCDWATVLSHYRWPSIARQVLEVFRAVDPQIGQCSIIERMEPARQRDQAQHGHANAAAAPVPGRKVEDRDLAQLP